MRIPGPVPRRPEIGGYLAPAVGRCAASLSLPSFLAILLTVVVLAAGCGRTPSAGVLPTTSTSTEPPFVQGQGEILLEPVGSAGPDSFAGETFVPVVPAPKLAVPTSSTLLPPPPTPTPTLQQGQAVISYTGDTPALYGGSKSRQLADKEGQLRFLEQNPDKAAAFCEALNNDPTLRWSGGTKVQPSQLRDYFAELTPVMLTRDTRVTNHGYRDGRPTPRQSVLQAGQMVLVDAYGVPRVRCECGNPLAPPRPVPTTPRYTGPRWPDFDPTVIVVVQQTTVVIEQIILVDINTGETFVRPPGTSGEADEDRELTMWELTVEMTRHDEANQHRLSVAWTAEVQLNPDGTLTGTGRGTWDVDMTTWKADVVSGSIVANGTLDVAIAGMGDFTELGRLLIIEPSIGGLSVDAQSYSSAEVEEDLRSRFNDSIQEWIGESFTELDLGPAEDVVTAQVAAGDWNGSATLTPLR